MNTRQFETQMVQMIAEFFIYWDAQRKGNPDLYPEELESAEWHEQFQWWIDNQKLINSNK